MSENKEKVIFESKLKGGSDQKNNPSFKLNETKATMDIAKSLIQDYTFILTISTIKAIFGKSKDCDKLLDGLQKVWEQRLSVQLAEETKNYQDAIQQAFESETEISAETSEKIKKYMEAFCKVRDNAVQMAKSAVNDINKMILDNSTGPVESDTQAPAREETKND